MVSQSPQTIAMVIPSHKECGVYTYAHFLADGLKTIPSLNVKTVTNQCGNNLLAYPRFARELETKYDVVHIQYEFGRFGKIGVSGIATPFFYNAFTKNEKIITTLHELPQTSNNVIHFFQRFFLKSILEKSARIIVHTRHMQKKIGEWYPVHASKVVWIPHGMFMPPKIKHSPRPAFLKEKKVIGFFGFIVPHKNVEAIIDALKELPAEYVALIAGGARENDYLETLHERARRAGVESRIHWTGFIPDEKQSETFSWMDLVIFPYKNVTESGALHLALGNQRMVLTSQLPAFEEIKQTYGCLSTYSDERDIASQIVSLLSSKAKQKLISTGMKKFISERNWKTVARKHADVYQSLP